MRVGPARPPPSITPLEMARPARADRSATPRRVARRPVKQQGATRIDADAIRMCPSRTDVDAAGDRLLAFASQAQAVADPLGRPAAGASNRRGAAWRC
jgi:hypothetical protein